MPLGRSVYYTQPYVYAFGLALLYYTIPRGPTRAPGLDPSLHLSLVQAPEGMDPSLQSTSGKQPCVETVTKIYPDTSPWDYLFTKIYPEYYYHWLVTLVQSTQSTCVWVGSFSKIYPGYKPLGLFPYYSLFRKQASGIVSLLKPTPSVSPLVPLL